MKKTKRLQLIFLVYWIMLAYIIAALVWWFIALDHQNKEMAQLKINDAATLKDASSRIAEITELTERKTSQYIGEGIIFLLLIIAAAIYIYRAVNRQLKQGLQQQNFMMAITHELKTPIAVAQLNLETMQKRALTPEQQEKIISNTLQETARLNALCNNMLLTSQIDAGGYRIMRQSINFSHIVERSVEEYCTRYPSKEIAGDIAEDIMIDGDELTLQMAVNNLIDNAIKYGGKGPIKISLHHENTISLIVADNGDGIKEEEKSKVFEKYYRTGNEATRKAKGTGLGLYLTSRIIKAHHGKIHIEDNTPQGCRFVVTI